MSVRLDDWGSRIWIYADTQARLLTFVLIDGGLAGFVWGYVAIVIGFMFVYASLGEMASMSVNPMTKYQESLILNCIQGADLRGTISLGVRICPKELPEVLELHHRYGMHWVYI